MLFVIFLAILLINFIKSYKIMKIVISNTSGLNVVDKQFKPKYFIKNKLRFVTPYVYTYKLFSKERWRGKKLVDIMASEFCAYDLNYFIKSIEKGYIKVNNENIPCDYKLKNNDFIEHKLLLFEKPVICNNIIILYEDENFICVYKSSSIPTHPVGSYQYNSLLRIVQNYISSCLNKESNQTCQNPTDEKAQQEDAKEQIKEVKGDVIKICFNFKKVNVELLQKEIINCQKNIKTQNKKYIKKEYQKKNIYNNSNIYKDINNMQNNSKIDNTIYNNLENMNGKTIKKKDMPLSIPSDNIKQVVSDSKSNHCNGKLYDNTCPNYVYHNNNNDNTNTSDNTNNNNSTNNGDNNNDVIKIKEPWSTPTNKTNHENNRVNRAIEQLVDDINEKQYIHAKSSINNKNETIGERN
uniref:Pseudouridylate synthase n=1 Tax=Piliocolobus tephrosceles TaxID=591936 RepID=A0A8C9GXJ2_9PRIM